MMESPKMFTTLIGKNPDDEAPASDGPAVGKAETFGIGRVADELENDVSDVNTDGVCVEGKIEEVVGCGHDVVGVVKEEGNLVSSAETGNECVDEGTKCSDFGIEESGLEHDVGEMEDAAVVDSLEAVGDVPAAQQADSDGNVTTNFDAMEIQVAELVDEEQEQPPPSKEDIKVGVSGDDLVKEQNAVHEEGSFKVGDVVWCMAKNNIWWPALICDPSEVPKQVTKNLDSEKHLVRHFGSKTIVWCPPSHLKHFLESFKEMSIQGKSKSFLGATEKAAEEVGRRVKLEMTCSCISKEIRARLIGRNKDDFKPWYVSNDTVARHFDVTRFLERVKNLARMSNLPDVVETVATRSYVSAYYCYVGHSQMYLRHLRDTDGPNGDATLTAEGGMVVTTESTEVGSDLGIEKDGQFPGTSMMEESPKLTTQGTAEKGFESRERKKSKYLSFPFIDPSATKSLLDTMDLSEASDKRNSSSSKRLLGKSARKFSTATSSGGLKDLKVSSAQLLTELRDTSRGYFYLNGNTILNSTFDFFCEFRRYTFDDSDNARNWYNEDGIVEKEGLEVQVASPLSEVEPAKKRKKSVTNKLKALNSKPIMDQVKDMNLKACRGAPVAKALTKNRKRKELAVANHQTNKIDGGLDLNSNGGSPGPHANSSDKGKGTEANSQPKKRKNKLDTTASDHELENGIIKAKPLSLVVDLFIDSHSLAGLLEANVERHFGETPASLNANTASIPRLPETVNLANSELVKVPRQMELLPTEINSDKKLENPSSAETSSGLPDLNGNGLEPHSCVTSCKQPFHAIMIPASRAAARVEELPLSVIRSNLVMMTKMLEESGSNISPDMRAKLENDVQGLLEKIKDVNGNGSPSS